MTRCPPSYLYTSPMVLHFLQRHSRVLLCWWATCSSRRIRRLEWSGPFPVPFGSPWPQWPRTCWSSLCTRWPYRGTTWTLRCDGSRSMLQKNRKNMLKGCFSVYNEMYILCTNNYIICMTRAILWIKNKIHPRKVQLLVFGGFNRKKKKRIRDFLKSHNHRGIIIMFTLKYDDPTPGTATFFSFTVRNTDTGVCRI